ncbi:hypothetical protein L3X38_010711 [Prunus dulcis]|uniref:Uncharacterized protein n=1 Tax=Prunus dulcis TaxID=3755 RepID=A0AAD4ZEF7_PRUDU|nr:hypothetical protein L3X38_010710 [Prunus dulcis]KAI5342835.1 hypothetical protein L3X38_010711 [Prunus dulcis]
MRKSGLTRVSPNLVILCLRKGVHLRKIKFLQKDTLVANFPEDDDDIPLNADSFSGMKTLNFVINKHGGGVSEVKVMVMMKVELVVVVVVVAGMAVVEVVEEAVVVFDGSRG